MLKYIQLHLSVWTMLLKVVINCVNCFLNYTLIKAFNHKKWISIFVLIHLGIHQWKIIRRCFPYHLVIKQLQTIQLFFFNKNILINFDYSWKMTYLLSATIDAIYDMYEELLTNMYGRRQILIPFACIFIQSRTKWRQQNDRHELLGKSQIKCPLIKR